MLSLLICYCKRDFNYATHEYLPLPHTCSDFLLQLEWHAFLLACFNDYSHDLDTDSLAVVLEDFMLHSEPDLGSGDQS